jgi:LPS sulfotransferase NodH
MNEASFKALANYLRDNNFKPKYKKCYLIAITARSGSTMLCDILTHSNLVGNPKEYFNPSMLKSHGIDIDDFEPADFVGYFDKITTENTTDGCFGIKLNFHQAKYFIGAGVFELLFPEPKIINLFRRNILKQAISLDIAVQTNQFHSFQKSNRNITDITFNYRSILTRINSIYNDESGWIQFLDVKCYSYIKLYYEDLLSELDFNVKTIFSLLGVQSKCFYDKDFSTSNLKKLSNHLNDDFYSKFKCIELNDPNSNIRKNRLFN